MLMAKYVKPVCFLVILVLHYNNVFQFSIAIMKFPSFTLIIVKKLVNLALIPVSFVVDLDNVYLVGINLI